MILQLLELSNYKQYQSLRLEFREGLVGIIGKNGSGKSTLFEAILYCLFGKDESNKALVRSSFIEDPKANVELALTFSVGEKKYHVKREFRGKAMAVGAELYLNDQLIAKGLTAVNEELANILHMEREAFKRSVFSGQKELSELSETSGEARKKMVRKMLGLETLDEVQRRVGADQRDLQSQIAGQKQLLLSEAEETTLSQTLKTLGAELKRKESALKKETQQLQRIETEYGAKKQLFQQEEQRLNQHHALERALAQTQEKLNGLTEQKKQLELKLSDLQSQQQKLEQERPRFAGFEAEKKRLSLLEEERRRQLNKEAVLARISETQQHTQHAQQQLETLQRELTTKDQVAAALHEKQGALAATEAAIEKKRNDLRELEKQIGGIAAAIRERSEKLAALQSIGKEGACPTCLQPLLEGYERVLADLDQQIQALQSKELQTLETQKNRITAEGLELKNRLTQLRTNADELLQQQSRLGALSRQQQSEEQQLQRLHANLTRDELILREIGEVHFDQQQFESLQKGLQQREAAYLEFQKAEAYLQRELPPSKAKLVETEAAIGETAAQVQARAQEIAALKFQESAYLAAKEAFTGFDNAYTEQSTLVRQVEKEALDSRREMDRIAERLKNNEAVQSQIHDKLEEVELLGKLYEHLGNFKTEILEKVSPGISKEAGELFSRITKGKYESILVDENFDFSIADGARFYPIERFSGGEVDLANFCLRIAITKTIMDLSGSDHRLEFLAFDEIFGSQDEERRVEMMLALNYLQEQFRQIYIISHIESLRDFFPHLLEVQSAPEGSNVIWR